MKLGFKWKYFAAVVTMFILGLFQISVLAQETGTINFSYVGSGIEVKLYKVADIDNNKQPKLSGDFSGYSVSFKDNDTAKTLALYADRDKITPNTTVRTNSDYNAVFNNLDRGVYLIVAKDCTIGRKQYTASPSLVSLLNESTDRVIFVTGKYEVKTKPGGGGHNPSSSTVDVSVLKVWKGGDNKTEVIAQLLKDGTVHKEAVLNSNNNWRYTWENLNDDYNWTVVEKQVPKDYVVSIEKDGNVFVLVNTYKPNNPSEEESTTEVTTTPDHGDERVETTTHNSDTPDTPDTPDNPNTPNNPDNPNTPDSPDSPGTPGIMDGSTNLPHNSPEIPNRGKNITGGSTPTPQRPPSILRGSGNKLPQTGQLWWPVPIFACLGILFVIIGIGYRREEIADES